MNYNLSLKMKNQWFEGRWFLFAFYSGNLGVLRCCLADFGP
jgi:hypothetical protein